MLVNATAGVLFGFVGSMPVAGPVAVLVVARSLEGRGREGLLLGAGAALAEAIYALFAYVGLSALVTEYWFVAPISQALAALILLALGVVLWRYRPPELEARARSTDVGSFVAGFMISALNPTLIVTWAAVLGIVASTGVMALHPDTAVIFAIGVAAGAAGWFALAVGLIGKYRERFSERALVRIHRTMGVFVFVLGIAFVVSAGQDLAAAFV